MKYIITIAASAQAETFCQWTGSAAANCVYAKLGTDGLYRATVNGEKKNFVEAQANEHGYFLTETTPPIFDAATHKQGARIETKPAKRIQWTYEVIALTTEEINQNTAAKMTTEMYFVLKWLKTPGAIICDNADTTKCHINTASAPNGIKAAYLAYQALGQ